MSTSSVSQAGSDASNSAASSPTTTTTSSPTTSTTSTINKSLYALPWILLHILNLKSCREIPLSIMFSFNAGGQVPNIRETYNWWRLDPHGELIQKILQTHDKRLAIDVQSPLGTCALCGPDSPDCNTNHCPFGRLMDPDSKSNHPMESPKHVKNKATGFSSPTETTESSTLYLKDKGLPASVVRFYCLEVCFKERYEDANFNCALRAMDYLRDLEYTRRSTLRDAALRLGIGAHTWRQVLATNSIALKWVETTEKEELEVEALYSQLYVDLRVWIMKSELEKNSREAAVLPMLNTLFPPVLPDMPNDRIEAASLKRHRMRFYEGITSVRQHKSDFKNGKTAISDLFLLESWLLEMEKLDNKHSYPNVRKSLVRYLDLAEGMIESAKEMQGVKSFPDLGIASANPPSLEKKRSTGAEEALGKLKEKGDQLQASSQKKLTIDTKNLNNLSQDQEEPASTTSTTSTKKPNTLQRTLRTVRSVRLLFKREDDKQTDTTEPVPSVPSSSNKEDRSLLDAHVATQDNGATSEDRSDEKKTLAWPLLSDAIIVESNTTSTSPVTPGVPSSSVRSFLTRRKTFEKLKAEVRAGDTQEHTKTPTEETQPSKPRPRLLTRRSTLEKPLKSELSSRPATASRPNTSDEPLPSGRSFFTRKSTTDLRNTESQPSESEKSGTPDLPSFPKSLLTRKPKLEINTTSRPGSPEQRPSTSKSFIPWLRGTSSRPGTPIITETPPLPLDYIALTSKRTTSRPATPEMPLRSARSFSFGRKDTSTSTDTPEVPLRSAKSFFSLRKNTTSRPGTPDLDLPSPHPHKLQKQRILERPSTSDGPRSKFRSTSNFPLPFGKSTPSVANITSDRQPTSFTARDTQEKLPARPSTADQASLPKRSITLPSEASTQERLSREFTPSVPRLVSFAASPNKSRPLKRKPTPLTPFPAISPSEKVVSSNMDLSEKPEGEASKPKATSLPVPKTPTTPFKSKDSTNKHDDTRSNPSSASPNASTKSPSSRKPVAKKRSIPEQKLAQKLRFQATVEDDVEKEPSAQVSSAPLQPLFMDIDEQATPESFSTPDNKGNGKAPFTPSVARPIDSNDSGPNTPSRMVTTPNSESTLGTTSGSAESPPVGLPRVPRYQLAGFNPRTPPPIMDLRRKPSYNSESSPDTPSSTTKKHLFTPSPQKTQVGIPKTPTKSSKIPLPSVLKSRPSFSSEDVDPMESVIPPPVPPRFHPVLAYHDYLPVGAWESNADYDRMEAEWEAEQEKKRAEPVVEPKSYLGPYATLKKAERKKEPSPRIAAVNSADRLIDPAPVRSAAVEFSSSAPASRGMADPLSALTNQVLQAIVESGGQLSPELVARPLPTVRFDEDNLQQTRPNAPSLVQPARPSPRPRPVGPPRFGAPQGRIDDETAWIYDGSTGEWISPSFWGHPEPEPQQQSSDQQLAGGLDDLFRPTTASSAGPTNEEETKKHGFGNPFSRRKDAAFGVDASRGAETPKKKSGMKELFGLRKKASKEEGTFDVDTETDPFVSSPSQKKEQEKPISGATAGEIAGGSGMGAEGKMMGATPKSFPDASMTESQVSSTGTVVRGVVPSFPTPAAESVRENDGAAVSREQSAPSAQFPDDVSDIYSVPLRESRRMREHRSGAVAGTSAQETSNGSSGEEPRKRIPFLDPLDPPIVLPEDPRLKTLRVGVRTPHFRESPAETLAHERLRERALKRAKEEREKKTEEERKKEREEAQEREWRYKAREGRTFG